MSVVKCLFNVFLNSTTTILKLSEMVQYTWRAEFVCYFWFVLCFTTHREEREINIKKSSKNSNAIFTGPVDLWSKKDFFKNFIVSPNMNLQSLKSVRSRHFYFYRN